MNGSRVVADNIKRLARGVLEIETQALAALVERIDDDFVAACQYLLDCRGRIVVLGIGKSGHIGGKLAATLASTGSPAFFVHPAEASHGDLGMITDTDVVIMLSNSGETVELLTLVPLIKRLGVPLIALTGHAESNLAKAASVHIDVAVAQEACPLGLAPTASTTAALAMGDALAIALLQSRGFTVSDFARSHPGGRLGRRLLVKVEDVMHSGEDIPRNTLEDSLDAALLEMTGKRLGMTVIVDAEQRVLGVFTDGDLRRALRQRPDLHRTRMADLMTAPCKTIGPNALAAEAVRMMETHKIFVLPVVDDEGSGKLIGAFNLHDLFRANVV